MKITLVNPPHTAIGSRIPDDHLPPLGLLSIGGPLLAKALRRLLFHPDADFRQSMRWYSKMGRRVWTHEVLEFVFRSSRQKNGPTLREFMGASLDDREYAMDKSSPAKAGVIRVQARDAQPG